MTGRRTSECWLLDNSIFTARDLRARLVLTGSTSRQEVEHFPYRPNMVAESVADLLDLV